MHSCVLIRCSLTCVYVTHSKCNYYESNVFLEMYKYSFRPQKEGFSILKSHHLRKSCLSGPELYAGESKEVGTDPCSRYMSMQLSVLDMSTTLLCILWKDGSLSHLSTPVGYKEAIMRLSKNKNSVGCYLWEKITLTVVGKMSWREMGVKWKKSSPLKKHSPGQDDPGWTNQQGWVWEWLGNFLGPMKHGFRKKDV